MISGKDYFSGKRRPHGPFKRGVFKYIILDYLKDDPAHGYEIIRALEERFHGLYVPSPGTIYPTLQMIEEKGFVTSVEEDGKKIYTITEKGRRYLNERADLKERIEKRIDDWGNPENINSLKKTMREFGKLRDFLHREARKTDAKKLAKIGDVLSRAVKEIEKIMEQN
jgi:DNA-binding PadR family transcriptional regulator